MEYTIETAGRIRATKYIGGFILIIIMVASIGVVYGQEVQETKRGSAEFRLSYRYFLKNEGPLDLTSVTLRLAELKDWEPIQKVSNFVIDTAPNQTTIDEYDNHYLWYEYTDFRINQTLDLWFHANVTLDFVNYATPDLAVQPYNVEDELYQLYTAYHPLSDYTDPNIRHIAQLLEIPNDPIGTAYNLYNFTANYIDYRLLSSIRGATYALRNHEGDCDEYTTLFVALARSLGIPAVSHTAWLAEFETGFVGTDDGAIAHAYPMFFVQGVGMLPVDPTRGKDSIFDNWLKTDHKRITMTRGPDNPYRLLQYRWLPVEGLSDPSIISNYTIMIHEMNTVYTSILRSLIILSLVSIPAIFGLMNVVVGFRIRKENKQKLERLLSPE
ncbi:MAG: transglutaminase family protein [Candidatus Thorarchaeota archaeon]